MRLLAISFKRQEGRTEAPKVNCEGQLGLLTGLGQNSNSHMWPGGITFNSAHMCILQSGVLERTCLYSDLTWPAEGVIHMLLPYVNTKLKYSIFLPSCLLNRQIVPSAFCHLFLTLTLDSLSVPIGENRTDMTCHSPSLAFYLSLGVEEKLDNINQLKVKSLVLGPLHTVQADQPNTLNLEEIDPTKGTEADLLTVLEKAHRKGRSSAEIIFLFGFFKDVKSQISTDVGSILTYK